MCCVKILQSKAAMLVQFQDGPIGFSLREEVSGASNSPRLFVTKSEGQALQNGVLIGDQVLLLNNQPCTSGAKAFKQAVKGAGRPFTLTITRGEASSCLVYAGAGASGSDKFPASGQAPMSPTKRAMSGINARAKTFAQAMAVAAEREAAMAAVKTEGGDLQFVSPLLRGDRAVVEAAVLQDGLALEFAACSLQDDFDLVLQALHQSGGMALRCVKIYLFNGLEVLENMLVCGEQLKCECRARAALTGGPVESCEAKRT